MELYSMLESYTVIYLRDGSTMNEPSSRPVSTELEMLGRRFIDSYDMFQIIILRTSFQL